MGRRNRWRYRRTHIAGDWIIGSRFQRACNQCSIPPWERCECSVEWGSGGDDEPDLFGWQREHLRAILNEEPENESGATG